MHFTTVFTYLTIIQIICCLDTCDIIIVDSDLILSLCVNLSLWILPFKYKVTISVCKSHEVICLLRPLSTLDFQPKVSFCLFQNVLTYEQTVNIIQPEVYYTKPVFEMAKMTFTHPCNPLCNGPWFIHKCSLIKNWSLYVTFAICGGCLFFVFLTLFPLIPLLLCPNWMGDYHMRLLAAVSVQTSTTRRMRIHIHSST